MRTIITTISSAVLLMMVCVGAFAQNPTYFNGADLIQVNPESVVLKNGNAVVDPNGASLNGSHAEKCFQHDKDEALKISMPGYAEARASAEEETARIINEIESGARALPPVYTIPVVFHVIHKGESVGSGTNISDAQILSSIDALNRDYRRTIADGGIGQGAGPDTEIQFCLATVDINGNPTSGINRVNGSGVSQYSSQGITSSNEVDVKDLSRWDNRYYLNIWVVSEIDNNGADVSNPANFTGGVLGYSYLPTNPVTSNSDKDGVVAINLCVGNDPNQTHGYRLWPWGGLTNRTITHEVGHVLNLYHPFEGQSCSESNCNTQGDLVCDTPPTQQGSTCNSPICSNAIVENYMDYTSESCQNMFTNNQTTRMRATLTGPRNALVNTNNCAGSGIDWDASISNISTPSGTMCATTFTPSITLTNNGGNTLTGVTIQYYLDTNTPTNFSWSGNLSSGASTAVSLPSITTTTGAHSFTAGTVSNSLNGNNNDQETANDASTSNFNISGNGAGATLTLDLDCFGDEITWTIEDANNSVVASGGPYVNVTGGEQQVVGLCLSQGCYDFIIEDTFGDGMNGSQWQNCSIDGDYEIVDGQGQTLVATTAANADFGNSATHNFCIGGGPVTPNCDTLVYFDGGIFYTNNQDSALFDVQSIDNDGEAVSTTLANNGYTSDWMVLAEVVAPGDTNLFARSTSWHVDLTAPSDNWLTFGPMTIPSDGAELTWMHRFVDNDYRDGYSVKLNTTGTDIADFNGATILYSVTDNDPATDGDNTWTPQTVALPAGTYAGQSVYIAIHHAALNMYFLDIDEVYMEGCSSITVGVENQVENLHLAVFPNPSNGNITVAYKGVNGSTSALEVVDALGRSVLNKTLGKESGKASIDLSYLQSGIYSVILHAGSEVKATRILIQN